MKEYSPDYIEGFIDALKLVVQQFEMIKIIDKSKLPDGINALKDKKKLDDLCERRKE